MNETGKDHAFKTGQFLKTKGFDPCDVTVFSSPFAAALETSCHILNGIDVLNGEVVVDEGLAGTWQEGFLGFRINKESL